MANLGPKVVPKIIIDARGIGSGGHGFARTLTAMAAALQDVSEYEIQFLVERAARGTPLPAAFSAHTLIECDARFLSPREWFEIPRLLGACGADLFHSPTFASWPISLMPCPWAITVHDLNHRTYGGIFERLYYSLLLRPFCQGARAVSSVSAFAAGELAEWLDRDVREISVIPNVVAAPGSEESARLDILAKLGLESQRYFFCVSGSKPHKNLVTVIAAWAALHDSAASSQNPPRLVVPLEKAALAHLAQQAGASQKLRTGDLISRGDLGFLSDADIQSLMAHSTAALAPSRYEGFGLAPLEALLAGAPVLVSDIAPHRESLAILPGGERTYLRWISPNRIDAWAEEMDRAWRQALSGKRSGVPPAAKARLEQAFSSDAMRFALLDFYAKALTRVD